MKDEQYVCRASDLLRAAMLCAGCELALRGRDPEAARTYGEARRGAMFLYAASGLACPTAAEIAEVFAEARCMADFVVGHEDGVRRVAAMARGVGRALARGTSEQLARGARLTQLARRLEEALSLGLTRKEAWQARRD